MGIGLDARGLRVHVSNSSEEASTPPNSRAPAVLIPMLRGEPLQVEDPEKPRSRGTGFDYPLEAKYSPQTEKGCGRFPLAEIWSRLGAEQHGQIDQNWKWQPYHRHPVPPIKALNTFVGHSLRNLKKSSETTPGPAVVVVPNHITIEQRSQLLRSLRDRTTKLLWRPIAAAMAWSRENLALLDDPDQPQFYIYCLHLGLEGFTIDQVPFREYAGSSETALIPVRKRSLLPHCPEIGIDTCQDILKELGIESDEEVWKSLYSSSAPERLFENDAFKSSLSEYWVRQISDQNTALVQWLEQVKTQIERKIRNQNPGLPHAVICTGEFSMALPGDTSLPQLILKKLGIETEALILESNSGWLQPGSLAISAHTYSRNLAEDRVSYLDELPDLQLLVKKRTGVPAWRSLRKDSLVPGGKAAVLHTVKDFSLIRGDRQLDFYVHHEDHETVRKAALSFSQAYDEDIQLALHVSLEPAGGNAVIEARPLKQTSEIHFDMVVDWDRAEDTGKTPEEILEEQPLAFPPHAPRTTSLERWYPENPDWRFLDPIEKFQDLLDTGTDLDELHELTDPAFLRGNISALFDSDGHLPPDLYEGDEQLATTAQSFLFQQYRNRRVPEKTRQRILRCLAYMSWNNPEFLAHLKECLESARTSQAHMVAYGQCLRTKELVRMFAKVSSDHLERCAEKTSGENECIKALWRILRYRSDACNFLPSLTCSELIGSTGEDSEFYWSVEKDANRVPDSYDEVLSETGGHGLLFILDREYSYHLDRGDQMAWIANYSCCGILWLLRRRIFEPNFLPPNSLQALMAKKLASRILIALQNQRIEAINARFSQEILLEEFIKYIDQEGGQLPAELFDA